VLGTGWFGAVVPKPDPARRRRWSATGAVGLLAILAARQFGAERVIAMSRHEPCQRLARE
jgi:Zn-dependent alcohol dehydrogenase